MDRISRGIRQSYDILIGADDPRESTNIFFNTRRKRKASKELHRPPKARRRHHHLPSQPTQKDYESASFFDNIDNTAERRTSKAELGGASTVVINSGTDTESNSEPPHSYHALNRPKKAVGRGSSGKPVNPVEVRAARSGWLDRVKTTLSAAVGDLGDFIGQVNVPDASPVLEHAWKDLEHAKNDVEEAQAQIEDSALPSQPIQEYQPSSESEDEQDYSYSPVQVDSFQPDATWTNKPNVRARLIVRNTDSLEEASSQIKEELREPEYAYRDIEIRDAAWQIMDKMERFAKDHFNFEINGNKKTLERIFRQMEPETTKVLGCVASGGPGGEDGWRELFRDKLKRRALVCAVIGNVLVEQVFQHACFGADGELLKALREIQEEMQNDDGKYPKPP
jgi:hypothetical protein